MARIIFLFDRGGWKDFNLESRDIEEELTKRDIKIHPSSMAFIGSRVRIGNRVNIDSRVGIGEEAVISSGVSIGEETSVGEGVRIGEEVSIGNRVSIGCYANIGPRTTIGALASIGRLAIISLRVNIGSGAIISPRAVIGSAALINENEKAKSIYIIGSNHPVLWWGKNVIQIGCKQYSIAEWQMRYKEIGEDHNYDAKEIKEYKGYIDMIATLYASSL
jgi:UDP-3-O-[3-hydroxymyristoyl] glucosamine N-acyltransferase